MPDGTVGSDGNSPIPNGNHFSERSPLWMTRVVIKPLGSSKTTN